MIQALVSNNVLVGVADVQNEHGHVEYGFRRAFGSVTRCPIVVKGKAWLVPLYRLGYSFVRLSDNERHCFLSDEHGQLENVGVYDL